MSYTHLAKTIATLSVIYSENTHGLLRQYFSKRTDFTTITEKKFAHTTLCTHHAQNQ